MWLYEGCPCYPKRVNDFVLHSSLLFSGNFVLHTPVAVEELGVGENTSPDDGPRPGNYIRSGEKTKEEAPVRLPLLKPEESQLLGIQILLLRAARPDKCRR